MIEIKNLSKQFGSTEALKDVSFAFDGKVLGVCGTGKTVLLNIICGVVPSTEGEVLFSSESEAEATSLTKNDIGYLLEDSPTPSEMTPVEFSTFIGKAKNVSKSKLSKQINTVLDIAKLSEVKGVYVEHLSVFERKLLGVAETLLGNPSLIVLDDPFSALTKQERRSMRQLIKTIGEIKPVIVSAKNISELFDVCEKIVLLSDGELLAYGTPNEVIPVFANNETDDAEDADSLEEAEYNNEEIIEEIEETDEEGDEE